MTRNKRIIVALLTFMACIGLTVGISAAVLAADEGMPEGATFYYQYVITDSDFAAGVRFSESYYQDVQDKIAKDKYVENTIVGIELSQDEKTMTIYMGENAGKEVNTVLQPYEQTQPAVDTGSSLIELEGWVGLDLTGKSQTLSSSYYIGSAVQTYYGQNNTTFTSNLKISSGFTYTLTLDDGQSIDEDWYTSALAAIKAGTEEGVLTIEKSEDGRAYTMYFDSYDFYKTTLSLPSVTPADTSTQVFENAWTDGTYTMSTTDSLATHLAYTDSGNTASIYAKDLTLSPSVSTKTYDIYIDLGSDGTLVEAQSYSSYVSGSGSGYSVSKTDDGMLLISGVQAGDTISIGPAVVDTDKMLDGFEVNTTKTSTGVSCSIEKEGETYAGTTWTFSDFSADDTGVSHTIYVSAVYADTAQMYVSLADGVTAREDAEFYATDSDIININRQNTGYLILTAREGTSIDFADVLSYDGHYTTSTAVVGTDGLGTGSMVEVQWIAITPAELTTVPTANTLTYTGSAQALVTAGATDGGTLYYSLTGTDDSWSENVPTATDAGTYTVYYKVTADEHHNSIEATTVSVTIAKAAQTAPSAPTLASSTTSSLTVTAVSANANGASAQYSLDETTWQSSTEFTGLTAGTAYTVYVRYAETDNYNASAAASASLSTASETSGGSGSGGSASSGSTDYDYNNTSSSSSSGSSSTSTTTTTNSDGSTTTTVTDTSAGTVTETTEYADGTTSIVVTDTDTGTVTETTEYTDGTVTETVIDGETGTITATTERADGSTIVAVTDGETGTKSTTEVTVEQVVIETVAVPEENVVATVTVPETVSTATVTIPAETTSGTVAINADTGKIVMLSVPTEDGVVITVDSSINIVLVDNSNDFTDTEGHWAEDAIDFATSHELFSGTSEETFSPDEAMTRGMLAQVLYNLEGGPDQSFVEIYEDVLASDWYSSAVNWASNAEIITGYGDGTFGPDDVITREQMATILYRYAQLKGYDVGIGADTNILSYQDYDQTSGYAIEAIQWAVGSRLIQGTSEGLLAPLGSATRAQIATILQRFITNATM